MLSRRSSFKAMLGIPAAIALAVNEKVEAKEVRRPTFVPLRKIPPGSCGWLCGWEGHRFCLTRILVRNPYLHTGAIECRVTVYYSNAGSTSNTRYLVPQRLVFETKEDAMVYAKTELIPDKNKVKDEFAMLEMKTRDE